MKKKNEYASFIVSFQMRHRTIYKTSAGSKKKKKRYFSFSELIVFPWMWRLKVGLFLKVKK